MLDFEEATNSIIKILKNAIDDTTIKIKILSKRIKKKWTAGLVNSVISKTKKVSQNQKLKQYHLNYAINGLKNQNKQ